MSTESYWRERAERMLLQEERKGVNLIRTTAGFYSDTASRIQKDIDAFYNRYAKDNQISTQAAKQMLTPTEHASFQQALEHYISASRRLGFGNVHQNELRLLAGRAHITRQQALLTQARQRIEALFSNGETAFHSTLQGVYTDGYQATAQGLKLSGDFACIDTQTVDRLLRAPWLDGNYSSRLWKNKTMLTAQLEELIPRAFATGENSRVLGQQLANRLGVSRSAAERLARTEVNHAANESARLAYQAANVEEYEYLATLDRRTSEECAALDGKVFAVKDAQAGRNYPPMHPNCRSTTIPYFAPDEFDGSYTRAARKSDGSYYTVSADTTYGQWKNTLASGMIEKIPLEAIAITASVIDSLTTPPVPGWSVEQNAKLNERHRELLRLAAEQPLGNEVGMYMDERLEGVVSTVGEFGKVKMNTTKGTVYMHNHISGQTFTYEDVERILWRNNIKVLTAVGNNGSVYMLVKTDDFDLTSIEHVRLAKVNEHPDRNRTAEMHLHFVRDFLQAIEPHGLIYLEG